MKIAKVVDQFGWAYYFLDKEQQKYSRHQIVIQKHNKVDFDGLDAVYIHGPDISPEALEVCLQARDLGITVIGGHAGPITNMPLYPYLDMAVGISPQTFRFCQEHYDCPAIFLPEGVDTKFFVPLRRGQVVPTWGKTRWYVATPSENLPIPSLSKHGDQVTTDLIVGWAGRKDDVKRTHLLEQLDFKVQIQSQHGKQFFVERSLNHMLRFYNSIDVFALVSSSECMPRVVLEACSCGIPVVCTDVGSIRMILGSDWIIPVNPERAVIDEMNKRLHTLENKDLRRRVGFENRQRIEKSLSWKVLAPYWDAAFIAAVEQNTNQINTINRHFGAV